MRLALKTALMTLAIVLVSVPATPGEVLPKPVGPWFGGNHERCASCHDPANDTADTGPGADTCLGCHGNIGRSESGGVMPASFQGDFGSGHLIPEKMYSPRLPQGGTMVQERLDCLTCHDPHGDDGHSTTLRDKQGPAILSVNAKVDKVSLFCVGCHEDMSRFGGMAQAYSRHPIGLPAQVVRESYLPELPLVDVRGTEDPTDDVIACTTCHYVHNGPNKYLLRWDRSIEGSVCGQCHIQGRPREDSRDSRRLALLR